VIPQLKNNNKMKRIRKNRNKARQNIFVPHFYI